MTFNNALRLMLSGKLCKRPGSLNEYGFPAHANGVLMKRHPKSPTVWWLPHLKRDDYKAKDWEISNGAVQTANGS